MNSQPLMNEAGNLGEVRGDNCQAIDHRFAGVVSSTVRLKTHLPLAGQRMVAAVAAHFAGIAQAQAMTDG